MQSMYSVLIANGFLSVINYRSGLARSPQLAWLEWLLGRMIGQEPQRLFRFVTYDNHTGLLRVFLSRSDHRNGPVRSMTSHGLLMEEALQISVNLLHFHFDKV
jgi:hypothetical protein